MSSRLATRPMERCRCGTYPVSRQPSRSATRFFVEIWLVVSNGRDGGGRGAISGLPLYPEPADIEPWVGEGLRTNMRSVFEAIAHENPYPMHYLDTHRWNHMVLKALFVGSRLAPIEGWMREPTKSSRGSCAISPMNDGLPGAQCRLKSGAALALLHGAVRWVTSNAFWNPEPQRNNRPPRWHWPPVRMSTPRCSCSAFLSLPRPLKTVCSNGRGSMMLFFSPRRR